MDITSMLMKAKYPHKDKVAREVKVVVQKYRDLRPIMEIYVFDDGTDRELICLDGTIPVTYKSNTYNIPMQFWLVTGFPHDRPLVFVRPTSQMTINPSAVVDSSGTVKLPYLDDWTYGRSDLISLIQILQHMFAERSPVYSKMINTNMNLSNPATSASQPATNNPVTLSQSVTPQNNAPYVQPVPVTYPQAAGQPYNAQPNAGNFWNPYWGAPPASQVAPVSSAAAAYPPMPVPSMSVPNTSGAPVQAPYAAQPPAAAQQQFMVPPLYANLPPVSSANNVYSVPQPPTTTTVTTQQSSASSTKAPSPPVPALTAGPGMGVGPASMLSRTGTVRNEHFKLSLMSAIIDKMNRKLSERVTQVTVEVQSLLASQAEIEHGRAELDGLVSELNREADRWADSLVQLRTRNKQLEELAERLKANELIPADDALVPTAPLYKQLLESYAEEQAYEDAIYCLGDSLHQETIDIDVYIKQIRQLARKQFYAKLIVIKCREKAGLPAV